MGLHADQRDVWIDQAGISVDYAPIGANIQHRALSR